jgi:hypothetical protein
MFNQAIVRIGVRYGVLCGIAGFAIILVVWLIGYNPLGDAGRLSFLPIPVFIFLAIKYYKQFDEAEIGFFKGLRIGLSVSFYTALSASMLLFILLYFAGSSMIAEYVTTMKVALEAEKELQIQTFGKNMYEQSYAALESMNPSLLATYDFVARLFSGFIFSIVAAVFFRK